MTNAKAIGKHDTAQLLLAAEETIRLVCNGEGAYLKDHPNQRQRVRGAADLLEAVICEMKATDGDPTAGLALFAETEEPEGGALI